MIGNVQFASKVLLFENVQKKAKKHSQNNEKNDDL